MTDVSVHNVHSVTIEHDTLPSGVHIIRNVFRDRDGGKIGEVTIFGSTDNSSINITLGRS